MSYIKRSCKKCRTYCPNNEGPLETCIQCRRYYNDYFKKRTESPEKKEAESR